MEEFKPKITTSGFIDFVIFLTFGILQTVIMFALPGYLIFSVTGNEILGWASGAALYIVFTLFIVKSITISESGIDLKRMFGNPKSIPWDRVRGYIEVTPKEVIIFGWLWPLFPAREMTPCMSCKGHVRIQLDDGYFYYPPNDLHRFREALEKHGARKL